MRPSEITDDEILAAGRKIVARGDAVTGWAIRREVGDRGQAKRLEKVWNEKSDTTSHGKVAKDDAEAVSLPTPLQEMVDAGKFSLAAQLDTIVAAIHRHARADADATYQRVTDKLQAETLHHRHELDLAEASVAATEAESLQRAEAVARLENELAEIRIDLANTGERERHALSRADDAEALVRGLRCDLEASSRTAQISAEARAAAEAQTAAMRDEVAHLRATLERSETARNTEVSRLSADLTRTQQHLDEARAAHQTEAATARQLASDAQAAHREEVNRVRSDHARVLAELEAAQRRQADAETVTREALGRAGEAAGRAAALDEQLRALQQVTTTAVPG
ncbi:DNA-binding protein [Paeniroseomonas aquatica]|uniref:KfrA N-terminal DNA-binding domain-containing protein n=1 Tax=Paeniroseomonas aquatica TaxID=373043 RepID=A0ABT8A0S7_9PROT|nr:DNA-binding protein [Paeniroseomonas aquatica]MDN3563144.1 hypothetical protein [Paeniroseomonas aquatica]